MWAGRGAPGGRGEERPAPSRRQDRGWPGAQDPVWRLLMMCSRCLPDSPAVPRLTTHFSRKWSFAVRSVSFALSFFLRFWVPLMFLPLSSAF